MLRPYKGTTPTVDATAFVDQSAQVIGDVHIGEASSVWMNVVIRGDVNRIRIGRRSNIQDLTMVHVMRDTYPTTIGDEVTVGHSACLHGCTIEDRVLIGMGATLLNGVHVGADSVVAAGSLLTEGTRIPPRSLVMGRPGVVKRALSDEEVAEIRWYADNYVTYRLDYMAEAVPPPGARLMGASTKPARGMRDFLPADVRRRSYAIGVVAGVYQGYGFEPLETPAVENIETLIGKYGDEGDRLIFKILKRGDDGKTGEADLALRYDLTVPLARVVAEHRGTLPRFFKRYQVQPVWRADRPQKGRFREFYQCDVDATGSASMTVEAELLAAGADVLQRLGFADFTIRLNHRQLLTGVLDTAGVPTPLHGAALIALDKADKIGREAVVAEMEGRGIAGDGARALMTLLFDAAAAASGNGARLDVLGRYLAGHDAGAAAVAQLGEILHLSGGTTAGAHIAVDATLARGLGYYTGAIFEIAVPDLAGSLGGGGRYDDLVGMFLGQRVPACGLSLGLERILVVMAERGMFPASVERPPADVLVANFDPDAVADALALAAELRSGHDGTGLAVEIYPDVDKLGKQFSYAAERGIPFVALAGSEERQAGQVTLKALASGTQSAVARGDAAAFIVTSMRTSRG